MITFSSQPHSIAEFRDAARRRLPKFVFDYVDGGSGSETTLSENRLALDRLRLLGAAPVDVSNASQRVTLFDQDISMPLIIGPTGLAGAVWPRGDIDLAQAASDRGIPFVMSTAATATMEDIIAAGDGQKWFQLYMFRDRDVSLRMVDRARALGFSALEVTVDNAIPGRRLRDARNGFSLPFRWTPRKLASCMMHPGWSLQMARAGGPKLELMATELGLEATDTIAELMQSQLDPSVSWDDIALLRDHWPGPLIVKGVLDPSHVARAKAIGVDGLVISNHGGRQLDGSVASIDMLPDFRREAGEALTLLIDSGFRTGSDIARAIALGADAVQVGRATLYALAAGGAQSVAAALEVLHREFEIAQMLMGLNTVDEMSPALIRRPWRDDPSAPLNEPPETDARPRLATARSAR